MTESTHDDFVTGEASTTRHPSNDQPMEPEVFDRGNPMRRCTAKLSNGSGERCRKWAIRGGNVCATHGGRAKQTVEKARRRLAENADRGAKQLLKLAFDQKQSADIRLKATLQLLDRAGVNAKTSVEVEVGVKPVDQIIEGITTSLETTSRDAYRRAQGHTPPALAVGSAAGSGETPDDDDEPLIGEVIDADEFAARGHVNVVDHTDTRDSYERARADRAAVDMAGSGGSTGGLGASRYANPDPGLMTAADAAEHVASLRRAAAQRARYEASEAGRAIVRRPQRALPPGRSAR